MYSKSAIELGGYDDDDADGEAFIARFTGFSSLKLNVRRAKIIIQI